MKQGFNRLNRALDARTKKRTTDASPMDLGTISEDGSLKLDQFGPSIPRSGYLVAEWMMDAKIPLESRVYRMASPVGPTGEDLPGTTYSPVSRLDFSGGDDSSQVPGIELRFSPALQPGDRVLVLWVHDEPIVISKVVAADA